MGSIPNPDQLLSEQTLFKINKSYASAKNINTLEKKESYMMIRVALITGISLGVTACAYAPSFSYDKPEVNVTGIDLIPSDSLSPRFRIHLNVQNPNSRPLPLKGISYKVSVSGFKVVSGVTNQLPTIPAYSARDIELEANTNVVSSLRLVNKLITRQAERVTYTLDAKLDVGTFLPTIRVKEEGQFTVK
jgi:LEA14-like dessication related protein